MSDSFVTPWTVTCQASLSIEFSRQEYRSGLPSPSPVLIWPSTTIIYKRKINAWALQAERSYSTFKVRRGGSEDIPLIQGKEPEKAMAPHSSTLAWKIPWTEEAGRLQSMGLLGVRHDWATSLSLFTFMHWRRRWQPTPVFLPGESQGWGSLVRCHLWGHTELDTTEAT